MHIWTNGLTWCIIFHFLQDFSPQLAKADLGNPNIAGVIMMNVPVIIIDKIKADNSRKNELSAF